MSHDVTAPPVERRCKKCGQSKPLDQFTVDARKKLGRNYTCRECHRAYIREWQQKPEIKSRKRKYAIANRERRRLACKRYRERHPDRVKKTMAAWALRNPERNRARWAVNNAVRDGRLKKGPCEKCGTTIKVDGHHDDYSKILEVRWLCHTCHLATEHAEEKSKNKRRRL